MKGDFSRTTYDARKHYAGVLMQQGRVHTDADWNEQVDIDRRRLQVETLDIVGPCGAPEDDPGFEIQIAAGPKLTIGAGRFYAHGLLCVNETDDLAYEKQPDLPAAPDWLDALTSAKATFGLAYLDVWERHVTALDDPLLREVALGGPHTATRVKIVWQVKVLPLASLTDLSKLKHLQKRAAVQKKLDKAKAAGAKPEEIAKLEQELAKLDAVVAALGEHACGDTFKEWDDLVADPDRLLNARTTPPAPAAGPCVAPPTVGYRRLENQLYRVEVHKPGPLGKATFKWSRDNGSVVTTIEKISGKDVSVHDIGPDEVLGFASGQWVEISDDASELAGKPGQLVQIDAVNASLRRITMKTAPTPLAGGADGVDKAMHPKLRRWDQSGNTATADGVATAAPWLPLEDGVEVQFSAGEFRTGDHWTIPARTATGEIEWPPFAIPNTAPIPQARRGIHHHCCRLALLVFDRAKKVWTVAEDCRPLFPPLTEPCCDRRSMHVVGTNWANDDLFPLPLTRDGLRIRLDTVPDPASLTNDTVQVAVELPVRSDQGAPQFLFNRQIVRGVVGRDPTDDHVIVWQAADLESAVRSTFVGVPTICVRVTLKGHVIWNDATRTTGRRRALDGQAFGHPGLRADKKSPRIALVFPSGHGAAASDFESWFLIAAATRESPLQVTNVRFLDANSASSSAGDVKPPLPAGTKVGFKWGEAIRSVEVTFNRAVDTASLGVDATASLFLEQVFDSGMRKPLLVGLQPKDAVVRIVLREPSEFRPGDYLLTGLGTAPGARAARLIVRAADDQTALDGDYDDQSGGNFLLPFTAF